MRLTPILQNNRKPTWLGCVTSLLWAVSLMLLVCSCGTQRTEVPQTPTPANLVQPCDTTLPTPASGQLRDLLRNHTQVAERFHQTCGQLNALIEAEQPPPKKSPPWWAFWETYF